MRGAYGQAYDKSWLIGTDAILKLTFTSSIPDTITFLDSVGVNWSSAASNISDTSGNILFYCNGTEVGNIRAQIMDNGDTLTDLLFYNDYQAGFIEPQTNIILPKADNTFYLFYYSESDSLYATGTIDEPDRLYYAVVDMNQNGGLGKVISKKNIAYKGLFGDCRLTACRHGNGRDWWLVHQGFQSNQYFVYRVTPDSIYGPNIQNIGPSVFYNDNNGAQSVFSADGAKFATIWLLSPQNTYYYQIRFVALLHE